MGCHFICSIVGKTDLKTQENFYPISNGRYFQNCLTLLGCKTKRSSIAPYCYQVNIPHFFLGIHSFADLIPGGTSGKEPACQFRILKRCWFDPWVGKIPWRRHDNCTPVSLPGEGRGRGSLVGCGPQACRELDITEVTPSSSTFSASHPTARTWINTSRRDGM